MQLGKLGVWVGDGRMTAADGAAFAKRVEAWGYAALWLPESRGRNVMVHSVLAARQHDTADRRAGHRQHLCARRDGDGQRPARASPSNRAAAFCSGSACRTCRRSRACAAIPTAGRWRRCAPISRRCARRPIGAPEPAGKAADDPRRARAAHAGAVGEPRRRRASLQRRRRSTPPRRAASSAPANCCARRSGCCSKPIRQRRAPPARQALANYMRLDNYVNNWRRLGFGDDDFAGGGSDRFIDANVAWGDEAAIRAAHPGALGRRRRPCLHPDDQPRRLAPARRRACCLALLAPAAGRS